MKEVEIPSIVVVMGRFKVVPGFDEALLLLELVDSDIVVYGTVSVDVG